MNAQDHEALQQFMDKLEREYSAAPELSQDYIRMAARAAGLAEMPLETQQMMETAEALYQRALNVQRQEQQG
jgi:hypothetical protein